MRIAIIGAGFTGLTTAYQLCQKGHQVTIFEKENQAGGLASGFKEKGWNWYLERFFHHLFVSDQAAKNLIQELNLFDKLVYIRAKTSIFKGGKISQFDSPVTLLAFPHLSLWQKARVGVTLAYLKATNDWQPLEKTTASSWLKKTMGENAYQILWHPLLQGKFAQFADQISMSWFWARIKKRSPELGYIEGGFQVLIDKLVEKIEANGGKILLSAEIRNFDDTYHRNRFDRVVFTTPISVFLKIASSFTSEIKPSFNLESASEVSMKRLKMLGALNLILILKEKFLIDNTYWLNINEPDFPFVAVVEHTNFVEPKHYGGNHLVYVGGYYPQNHRYFGMTKEEIFKEFLPFLQKINPKFNFKFSILNFKLAFSQYAQPVVPLNYSKIIPKIKTPLPKVYLANMQMVYPWDRGVNYAIELGERVANEIS